ncbi:efflux RND transporter permease subunit, partial [Pseudomonas sp. CrR25]|nr:efflux RND transporter permease subunit [Pseudomonas sp. CrR25]
MDIAAVAIKKRLVTLVLTGAMLVAGLLTYNDMSRLEDPEFTIKEALVVTPYAGASALEVEQEVSDRLEKAVQQLGQLERVRSKSERGLSTLTVTVKDNYDRESLPQVWDELRRKIDDVQRDLPPGAGPSIVLDDYGDVYSVFLVVTGDGYSYAELKDYVDGLRRELLLVQDVGKITTFGERREA